MHLTGDYTSNGSDFSSSKWFSTTEMYLDKIQNDLSSDNWTAIYEALDHLQESREKEEQIQVGGPSTPKRREALLLADPPTPPHSD